MYLKTLLTICVFSILQAACATVKLPPTSGKEHSLAEWQEIRAKAIRFAENGEPKYMEIAGNYYLFGWLGEEDLKKGNYWLHRSAAAGWIPANTRLAENYSLGIYGVQKDKQKSHAYVAEAYEQYMRLTAGQRADFRDFMAAALNSRGVDSIETGKKADALADFCLAISINPKSKAVNNLARMSGKCES